MHLIDTSKGFAAIAYRGETPWHGLGAEMPEGADLAEWRKAGGLDWEALSAPVEYITSDGPMQVEDKRVLYRSDTGGALSIVSDRYRIVQPGEIFEFYRDLCDSHGFAMETAGALKDGRVVWALARTGDVARISGNDEVRGYLLLSTSFDGSLATTARWTSVRVVCNNTLQIANAGETHLEVRHSTAFNADAAKIKLGIGDAWRRFAEDAQRMAEKPVDTRQAIEFFLHVYHDMKAEEIVAAQAEKQTDKTIARLAEIFHNAPGADLPSAKGTVWGLVNAITRDVDFHKRARSQDRRLTSAWFGSGAKLKERAWDAALKLAA